VAKRSPFVSMFFWIYY